MALLLGPRKRSPRKLRNQEKWNDPSPRNIMLLGPLKIRGHRERAQIEAEPVQNLFIENALEPVEDVSL